MGNLSIGNYNYTQPQYKTNTRSNQSTNNFGSVQTCPSSNITLRMNDGEGNKAITCIGFPNGGSASVFKSNNYTDSNPEYLVKYWDKESGEQEILVKPQEVNPENASYLEMLAYSTYLDEKGYLSDAFGSFTKAAMGTDVSKSYDSNSINEKIDFKAMIKSFMDMQYNAGNLKGYLSIKKFYDFMSGF